MEAALVAVGVGGAVRGRAERRGALGLELNPEPGEYAGPLEKMGPGRGSLQGLVGKLRGQEGAGFIFQRRPLSPPVPWSGKEHPLPPPPL